MKRQSQRLKNFVRVSSLTASDVIACREAKAVITRLFAARMTEVSKQSNALAKAASKAWFVIKPLPHYRFTLDSHGNGKRHKYERLRNLAET